VLGIWFFVWGRDLLFAEEEVSVKVLADASQSVVYARLDSVYGNEITYTVVNPVSEEENVSYALSTETGEDMIPVGTEVTTRLGTVSTFSRLRAGDYVALIMDQDGNEQVIAAVYVIG
jgi:hypothetical protein